MIRVFDRLFNNMISQVESIDCSQRLLNGSFCRKECTNQNREKQDSTILTKRNIKFAWIVKSIRTVNLVLKYPIWTQYRAEKSMINTNNKIQSHGSTSMTKTSKLSRRSFQYQRSMWMARCSSIQTRVKYLQEAFLVSIWVNSLTKS